MDIAKIEDKIDKVVTGGSLVATAEVGGIRYENANECMEAAKMLATAGVMVPPHLRGQPGACLAIIMQALEWGLPVMAVANKSYIVNNKGTERVAYESQLIHALIERRAPLKSRLRHEIIGEGDNRKCRVWGTFIGETEPHSFTSSTLGEIVKRIGRNEQGKIKGSPLWDAKPEVQMFYDASRDWARLFCPDVLLGAYAPEEFPDAEPVDVTPRISGLADRLRAAKASHAVEDRRGFNADHVHREAEAHASNSIIEGDAQREATTEAETTDGEKEAVAASGHDAGLRDGAGSADDTGAVQGNVEGASAGGDRSTQQDDRSAAGGGPENEEDQQQDIFPADRDDPNFPKPSRKRK